MCHVLMRTGWNCLSRIILCLYCRQVIINSISLFIDILCIILTAKSLLKVCRLVFCYPPTNAPPGECRWDSGSLNIFLLSSKFMSIIDIIASNSCKNHAIVPQYELNKLTNLSPVIPNMSSKPYFLTRFVLYDIKFDLWIRFSNPRNKTVRFTDQAPFCVWFVVAIYWLQRPTAYECFELNTLPC